MSKPLVETDVGPIVWIPMMGLGVTSIILSAVMVWEDAEEALARLKDIVTSILLERKCSRILKRLGITSKRLASAGLVICCGINMRGVAGYGLINRNSSSELSPRLHASETFDSIPKLVSAILELLKDIEHAQDTDVLNPKGSNYNPLKLANKNTSSKVLAHIEPSTEQQQTESVGFLALFEKEIKFHDIISAISSTLQNRPDSADVAKLVTDVKAKLAWRRH